MIVLGYNTPVHNPPSPEHDNLAHFHNELVMQAGAYQNGCWVVGVAKAGDEDGVRQIGNSIIVAPSGEIVAACSTEGDELAIARCDLDLTAVLQEHDVQLRAAPAAAGVRAHRRAQGRDTATAGGRWRADSRNGNREGSSEPTLWRDSAFRSGDGLESTLSRPPDLAEAGVT